MFLISLIHEGMDMHPSCYECAALRRQIESLHYKAQDNTSYQNVARNQMKAAIMVLNMLLYI